MANSQLDLLSSGHALVLANGTCSITTTRRSHTGPILRTCLVMTKWQRFGRTISKFVATLVSGEDFIYINFNYLSRSKLNFCCSSLVFMNKLFCFNRNSVTLCFQAEPLYARQSWSVICFFCEFYNSCNRPKQDPSGLLQLQ